MSEEQLSRLATYLKNRVAGAIPRDPELRLAVNRAIDAGLEDFLSRERLEAYKAVDVDRLVGDLTDLVPELRAQVDRLRDIVPGFDNLSESRDVLKDVVVGKLHRVTLGEFPVGVALRRTHLRRRDGSVGGVTLIRKW